MEISFFIVLGAGLASFFSPCVLPLIPTYLSYISGVGLNEIDSKKRFKLFFNTLAFVLGFTAAFVVIQVIVIYFANFASKYLSGGLIYKLAGILVIIMGLHLIGVFKLKGLMGEKRINLEIKKSGRYIISFLLGFLFGFGWSPCMGPLLFSVIAYASQAETMTKGIFYLIVYSIGLGLPFLAFSLFAEKFIEMSKKLRKYGKQVEIVSGSILIIMGIILFFNKLEFFSNLF